MYAIVETGGKQYPVEEGRYIDLELLDAKQDEKVTFDKIVMLVNGKKSKVGQPYVTGASVEGTVVKHDKAKKIIVFKQRPKKGYRKKQGHRQQYTRVMITKIRTSAKKETAEKAEA
ncbi:MAG: 50S ribosomal protein L21 [Candidatus Gastranaerophilaceae bacterium]|nr:50S ribosomal protein L21 [Candidatus Gastranaerophilaceae bacterium]